MIRKTSKPPRRALPKILGAALAFIAFLAFLAAFMEAKAGRELGAARLLASGGKPAEASVHYFRSLNWYSPLGSSQTAADELAELAASLESRGDDYGSYLAYLRLRAALNAARSFYFPRRDLLAAANAKIASYLARQKLGDAGGEDGAAGPAALERATAYFMAIYSDAPKTNEGWYLAAVGGFIAWTLSGALSIFRLFAPARQSNGLRRRIAAARGPLACFAAGYALWLAGMAFA
ncbi:MAG: hypothetical protein LBQ12_11685 [Deltaproteobacteria bacterium]|nr:hypothetical protein [Deltaproteobacteria bacterium]